MNTGKSKVMVGISGGPVVSVGYECIQTVKCTVCIMLIHKRCNGDLSLLVDEFRYKRYGGTTKVSLLSTCIFPLLLYFCELNFSDALCISHIYYYYYLVVDGETYGRVNNF